MVSPGCLASMEAATSAVVSEPETGSAFSSTRNTRSASPSKASPMSAPCSSTAAFRSTRFSGWIGSAGWFGKFPSSSGKRISTVKGSRSNTMGTTSPPMPLAVSATTLSGRSEPTSTKDTTWSAHSSRRFCSLHLPVRGGIGAPTNSSAPASMSAKPVSRPIGRAPDRHNLRPLYWAGLCDAVNMAPGESRWPDAKYMKSVEAMPRSTMSTPSARTPSENAAESATPVSRISRATRICGASAKRAMARPMARHMSASSWSGTVPRTRYALKTWSMRLTGPHHRWPARRAENVRHPAGPVHDSVDDGAPARRNGDDGDQDEGGMGDHVHAQAPGAVRDRGQDHAEDGQARQLHPFAVGQAEEQPVDDHGQDDSGGTGPAGRPQLREQADEPLQEQPAEEQLLHGRGEEHGEDRDHDEPATVGASRQLLRGAVEVVDVVLERGVDDGHEDLAPDADRDPDQV